MSAVIAFGTRPEFIKLAPLILKFREKGISHITLSTGQHQELLIPLFRFFSITPDHSLDVMRENQTLTGLSARVLEALDQLFKDKKTFPNHWIVQGDTTTAWMTAYWAFCQKIEVAHVEAGLRTHNLYSPFPEEANRQLIGRLAKTHFAPTSTAREHLLKEGIPPEMIQVVGNTGIDSLFYTLAHYESISSEEQLPEELIHWLGDSPLILVTAHRRESFGKPFEEICEGVVKVVEAAPQAKVIYPVHPNPNVRHIVHKRLGRHPRIRLIEPLNYFSFVKLMDLARVLLTDSGGVQEEGPSLRKPIVVMRETTERPEGVKAGFSHLSGTDPEKIKSLTLKALNEGCNVSLPNPYGDGKASEKISEFFLKKI